MAALRLRPLRDEDEDEARRAHDEMRKDGFTFLLGWDTAAAWTRYLERLRDDRLGVGLPDGWVPATFLVAEVEGAIVGRVSIRHALTQQLLKVGGHIGYGVRPAYRCRGHATEMLGQALVVARAEGVDRVLVTCDDDNVPSIRIIERHGGRLEDVRINGPGAPKRRYWID